MNVNVLSKEINIHPPIPSKKSIFVNEFPQEIYIRQRPEFLYLQVR